MEKNYNDPNLVSMGDKFWDKVNGDIVLVPNISERKLTPNPNKLKFNNTIETSEGNDEPLKDNEGSGRKYRDSNKLAKKEVLPSIDKTVNKADDAASKLNFSAKRISDEKLPPINQSKTKPVRASSNVSTLPDIHKGRYTR